MSGVREVSVTDTAAPPTAWPVLRLLACPLCHGSLAPADGVGLVCGSCGRAWSPEQGWLDFRAEEPAEGSWRERQASMEGWYENLITASDQAEYCWRHDYDPLAPTLGKLSGRVLDVGGGNGVVREYLAAAADLVVLDPSPAWLRSEWLEVSKSFPALLSPLTFVLGVAERLPFAAASFDVLLSLFSINHMAEPPRFIEEAGRVLRPGGRLLILMEDAVPTWRDIATPGYRAGWTPSERRSDRSWRTACGCGSGRCTPSICGSARRSCATGWHRSSR